ncbi:hypothetical protein AMK59_339 [Oryctes borbonicus]|uniref:Uncharacterized protein n=1 Tax=Oryctes borbonicus TaxID=1629725 RepID=A0A0T6BHT9_9SCAR|nr:hypothetical protein AMK59_339 [Oryctes borbonicus]
MSFPTKCNNATFFQIAAKSKKIYAFIFLCKFLLLDIDCKRLIINKHSADTQEAVTPIATLMFSTNKYRLSNMQRCPYIHEMKERLLGEQIPMEMMPKKIPDPPPLIMDQQPVATVVKLNSDGYGSHTSPTHHRTDRTPLMPRSSTSDLDSTDRNKHPKNAKTKGRRS